MSHLKSLKRLLSAVIVVIFFATNTLTPAWGAHAVGVENTAVFFSGNAFTIPVELGKVTDVIKGSDGAPLFIHIEEAHAHYAAQTNIKRILQHLTRNYGLDLILLEGASERLEPELFSFFPDDKKLNEMVTDRLLKAGELTGAEAMLMETPDKKLRGWGVEDLAAYTENLENYKEVYQGRKTAENFLDAFYLRWQKVARTRLNKSLREFLETEVAYEEDRLPIQTRLALLKREALSQLQIDLEDVREQKDWPVLVRYFRLQRIDAQIDREKVVKEQESFLADLAARKIPATFLGEITRLLNQKTAQGLPLYKTRFVFEKLLDALPKDYSFETYPAFRLHLQRLILLSELEGSRFQEEMQMLAQTVAMTLAKMEHEKQLTDILYHYRLLQKLFRLELRRAEYQEIQTRKITPQKLILDLGLKPAELSGVTTLYETAICFYEGAMMRENHMIQNAMVRLRAQKNQKAVLVTGGFHTEGLKKKIVADGNSYIGITPTMSEILPESNRHYLRALLGSDTVIKSQIGPEIISQPVFLHDLSGRRQGRLNRIREIVWQALVSFSRSIPKHKVEFENKFKRLLDAHAGTPAKDPLSVKPGRPTATPSIATIAKETFTIYREGRTNYVDMAGRYLRSPGMSDSLVLLIKPSIGLITEQTMAEVLERASKHGYMANAVRVVNADTIRKEDILGRHYFRHAAVAIQGDNALHDEERDEVKSYIESLALPKEPVFQDRLAFSATEIMEKSNLSVAELENIWKTAFSTGKVKKLGKGPRAFRVGVIVLPDHRQIVEDYRGKTVFVYNAFFPALAEDFTATGIPTIAIWLKKDPSAGDAATLQQMKDEFAGETDPEDAAVKHPDSLRARAFRNDPVLGLPGLKMDIRRNFIHLTAPEDMDIWSRNSSGDYTVGEFHAWFPELVSARAEIRDLTSRTGNEQELPNFFNPDQNFETALQRSEMRDDDEQDDEETPEEKKDRELSVLRRHLQYDSYDPINSQISRDARQYLLSLSPGEAIRLLLRKNWGTQFKVLADILPKIKKEAGADNIESVIVSEIPNIYPFSEEQAAFFLGGRVSDDEKKRLLENMGEQATLFWEGFLSHGAKKRLLGSMADVLEKSKGQDTSTYDAGEVSSGNVRLLKKLVLCFQKIRPYRFTFNRYKDIFIEYALNRSAPHSMGENEVAFAGLEALGEESFSSVLEGALTLQDGKFGTGQNFRFILEQLDSHFKKHKNFYYSRLITELNRKRYEDKKIARFLDLYGPWDGVDLQDVFPNQSDDFWTMFAHLFAFERPPFTQLIRTSLWAGARGDLDKAMEALTVLDSFTSDFLSRCFSTELSTPEEKLNRLIQSWKLDRVLSWAQSWDLAKARNLEPDLRIFETLLATDVTKIFRENIRLGNYGLVLEKIMKYGDPNLLQETFFFLLSTGGRLNQVFPELVKFINKYPLETTSLIPLLVIHLRFGKEPFSEHTDLKFLSDLLNVRRKSDIFLVRKLVQAFPYPRAMSNIDNIREYVKELDDQYGLKGFIRYIRMSIHRAPSSENLNMMNALLKAIGQENLEPFLKYIAPEFRSSLAQESTGQLVLLSEWNREIRDAAKVSGLREINTAEDLLTLPDESLERLIDAVPPDDGEKGIRHGLILFLRTYHSLRIRYLGGQQKLAVIAPDVDQAVKQGRYISAVESLLKQIANLDEEMDVPKMEEVLERTYATDHSLYEEERWGFELKGYAVVTKERSIAGFEQVEAVRQHALRLFEDYLEQFTKAHFVDGKEEKGIRDEILKDFDSAQLKAIRMSLRRFLDLLESSGLSNQDFRELGDILEYEDLSVAQTLDVFREAGIRLKRLMYMMQILFGGYGRKVAEYLGEPKLRTFVQTQGIQTRDKGPDENWAKVAEQKLIGDFFAEEGFVIFQNFLRQNQSLLEALKSRTPPLEVTPFRKQSEDVVLFYPGMKPEDGRPKLASQFGNKGLMLQKMAIAGYPVPPGFTISTDYLAQLSRPEQKSQLRDVVFKYVLLLERQVRRYFPFNPQKLSESELKQLERSRAGWNRDSEEPLLVSVRSGAFIPLPGVLDTFLKLPVTERVQQLLINAGVPKRIALDDRRRYLTSYATTVLGFQEAFFSRLIENMKTQMGKSQISVSEFDDASMERIVKGCENEIHNALLNLETIANTPLEGPDWQSRLLNNLKLLRETENNQAQFHTRTLFGMDHEQFKGLILQESKSKVEILLRDLRKRFEQWTAVTNYYDGDEFEILLLAVSEIAQSWNSYQAQEVLESKGISKEWGTPVTIQMMVHGNRPDSGAFVGHTHHQVTGVLMPDGYYKRSGEGEDLVSGRTANANRILQPANNLGKKALQEDNPELAKELVEFLKQQSFFGGGPRQIEGVVEKGQIYTLQNISLNLVGSFPGLLPTPQQQPAMRGEGDGGGAKWVRFFFDRDSFSKLETGIKELRKQMDAEGEEDVGIALITRYMTPEEGRKVDINGLDAMIVTAVGGSAHATIAAREAGKVVISSVSSLKKHPKINPETGETEEVWSWNGEDLIEGMEGKIYSIDGNHSGPTAGCIFEGKIKMETKSDVPTLAGVLRERNQGSSKRSEVRESKNSEIILSAENVLPPQNDVIGDGVSQFFRENERRGGGTEKGIREVTDKITNGIIPLLAHTMNVAEILMPVIAQIPWVQKIHVESARRVLGLDSDIGDAFILGSDLALRKGMIEMAKTIFKESAFAILVKNDADMVHRAEALIKKEGLENRVFVITDARLARSRITKPGTVFRGMISSDELMLADELKSELQDDLIVMDQGMQQRFLNVAGQLFRSLANEIAAQFLVARSA